MNETMEAQHVEELLSQHFCMLSLPKRPKNKLSSFLLKSAMKKLSICKASGKIPSYLIHSHWTWEIVCFLAFCSKKEAQISLSFNCSG